MNMIHVLVISQQTFFQKGVLDSLGGRQDIEIQGACELNDDVLSTIDTHPPDVALVDIDGHSDYGLSLARHVKQRSPSIAVVMLTSNASNTQLFEALKAQAVAYLSKEVNTEQLIQIIKRVSKGEHPINESLTTNPKVAEQVLNQFQTLYWKSEAAGFISPLTPRETEILTYIAQGYLNKQIAMELGISEQTIKNHVTSILRKLNANARTEAVVLAIKQGLISIS